MSNTEHIDDLQADKSHDPGCVTKCVGSAFKNAHGSYRYNGYQAHKSDPVKSTRYKPDAALLARRGFEKDPQIGFKKSVKKYPQKPTGSDGSWEFKGKNFKSANQPFVHMYHHLVPWDVMSEVFTLRELLLFQSCKYDINAGVNLMILPCYRSIGWLVGMHTHPNDHPSYSERLMKMLKAQKGKLKGDEAKHLRKKQVSGLKEVLERWAEREWGKLSRAGRVAMGAHVNEYHPSSVARVAARVLAG
jgi:hypothetical protein